MRRMLAALKLADSSRMVVVSSSTSLLAPPMTPASATASVRVGDDQHLGDEGVLLAVQRRQRLARAGATDDDLPTRPAG